MSIVRTLRAALGPHLLTPLRAFGTSARAEGLEEFIAEPVKEGEKVTAGPMQSEAHAQLCFPSCTSLQRLPLQKGAAGINAVGCTVGRAAKVMGCPVTGRSWSAEDLRRKSWDDLHKLWYVLLKERNLLLSERDRYKAAGQVMPNGRRMTKVRLHFAQGMIANSVKDIQLMCLLDLPIWLMLAWLHWLLHCMTRIVAYPSACNGIAMCELAIIPVLSDFLVWLAGP